MAQNDNISATEQLETFNTVAQKLTRVANLAEVSEEKIFYGQNNVNIHLQPLIQDTIGQDSYVDDQEGSKWYLLIQEDLSMISPIEQIVKFRDTANQAVSLPQAIKDMLPNFKGKPYWYIAINVMNAYKLYAAEKNKNTRIQKMIFLNQMLVKIESGNPYITLTGSCAKYTIDDNALSAEKDVLKETLKRNDAYIAAEYHRHQYFDANDLNNRNNFHQIWNNSSVNIGLMSHINTMMRPSFKTGQIYARNFSGWDSTAAFYISLYNEDNNDSMAQQWLMERGYFDEQRQAQLMQIHAHKKPMRLYSDGLL